MNRLARAGAATFGLFRQSFQVGQVAGLQVASTGFTMVFGILATRLIGADQFGKYVSIFAIAGLLTVVVNLGMTTLLQREVSASRGNGDRAMLRPLVQLLVFMTIVTGLASLAALVLGNPIIAIVLTFCLLANLVSLLRGLHSAHERVIFAIWFGDLLRQVVALIALVALVTAMPHSEVLPLLAQLIGAFAAASVLLSWRPDGNLRSVARAVRASRWTRHHGVLMRSGAIFAGTQLLISLTTQLDILILTAMVSPAEVAHYYAAVRGALVINFCFGASGMLAEPVLTRLFAAGAFKEVQDRTSSSAVIGSVMTVVAAICAIAIAPFYLRLYGEEFLTAFPSFCVFALGIAVRSFLGPGENLLRATRADRELLLATAFVLILNSVITVTLVPFIGILGAATGSAIQFAVYGVVVSRILWKKRSIRTDLRYALQRRG